MADGTTMREVWERVRRALDTHAPGLSKTLRPGADEAAIVKAESALGVRLERDPDRGIYITFRKRKP